MDTPDSPEFDPVQVRSRRDGWTPERQRQLVALLAEGGSTASALRILGKTKQALHALRGRPDAASFNTACDAALRRARQRRVERTATSAYERAMHGYFVPFYRRGRLVRIEHRFASMGLLRIVSRLDKMVDASRTVRDAPGAAPDYPRDTGDLDAPKARTRSIEHELGQFPDRMPIVPAFVSPRLPVLRGSFRDERVADLPPDDD